MGAASTTAHDMRSQTEQGIDPMVNLIMPVFYTKEPMTPEELNAATECWKMIVNNTSAHFDAMKASGEVQFETCMELYSHTFYHRIWDVHPVSKTLFHGSIYRQGGFVTRFLSVALDHIDDDIKWNRLFQHLAEGHNKMGIKGVEYGIYGEVLMYTIKKCVGPEVYTPLVAAGWAKLYSKMLDTLIPVCVIFEKECREEALMAHDKRFKEYYARREAVENRSDFTDRSNRFHLTPPETMLAPRKKLWSTPLEVIDEAIRLLQPASELVYDIGAGDGNFIIRCAQTTPSNCIGVEIDEDRSKEAQSNITESGLEESKCKIICGNALEYDYSDGTCFFLYLVPRGLRIILPHLQSIKHSIRVVTYMSPLPDSTAVSVSKISTATHPEAKWPLYYYELHPSTV